MRPMPGYNYFTDNGAVYCYEHLGASAKYTGRDISGQKIERIGVSDLLAIRREMPDLPTLGCCEICGRKPERD